jgi:hypothetical protein
MGQRNRDARTALQHAQDWKRSATILLLICFVIALAAFRLRKPVTVVFGQELEHSPFW